MLHISHSKNNESECADNASNIWEHDRMVKAGKMGEILNCT